MLLRKLDQRQAFNLGARVARARPQSEMADHMAEQLERAQNEMALAVAVELAMLRSENMKLKAALAREKQITAAVVMLERHRATMTMQ